MGYRTYIDMQDIAETPPKIFEKAAAVIHGEIQANNASKDLEAAIDNAVDAVKTNSIVSGDIGNAAGVLSHAVEALYARIGFYKPLPAIENYRNPRSSDRAIRYMKEGLSEALSAMFKAVKTAIAKLFEMISKLFKWIASLFGFKFKSQEAQEYTDDEASKNMAKMIADDKAIEADEEKFKAVINNVAGTMYYRAQGAQEIKQAQDISEQILDDLGEINQNMQSAKAAFQRAQNNNNDTISKLQEAVEREKQEQLHAQEVEKLARIYAKRRANVLKSRWNTQCIRLHDAISNIINQPDPSIASTVFATTDSFNGEVSLSNAIAEQLAPTHSCLLFGVEIFNRKLQHYRGCLDDIADLIKQIGTEKFQSVYDEILIPGCRQTFRITNAQSTEPRKITYRFMNNSHYSVFELHVDTNGYYRFDSSKNITSVDEAPDIGVIRNRCANHISKIPPLPEKYNKNQEAYKHAYSNLERACAQLGENIQKKESALKQKLEDISKQMGSQPDEQAHQNTELALGHINAVRALLSLLASVYKAHAQSVFQANYIYTQHLEKLVIRYIETRYQLQRVAKDIEQLDKVEAGQGDDLYFERYIWPLIKHKFTTQ